MPVYNLCRICLTEDTNMDAMQPLFEAKNARCAEIVQQIEECGGIVLKAHEEFPKMICLQCLESLNVSHKFRSMCQASEHALLDAIVKSELKTEPQDTANTNSMTDTADALRPDSRSDIFFDLRTEFIDAHEVDLTEITENKDDRTHEFFGDTDDGESIDADDGGSAAMEDDDYIDEEHIVDEDDDELDGMEEAVIEVKQEFGNKHTKRRIIVKRRQSIKTRQTPPGKRGRPRLHERAGNSIVSRQAQQQQSSQPGLIKPGRGRKKLEVVPANIMCEICGNIYAKRSLLNMHMRRHMADKPFQCEICGKKFACPSEVGRHIRVHTGEKPYVCRFCGRTFADRSTNIKHERIHTNERPFSCSTCGKSFTYSNVLKNHMLTHTGEKPFPCVPCNKTFSRKHQLDQHLGTITHQQTVKNLVNYATAAEFQQPALGVAPSMSQEDLQLQHDN